MAGRTLKVYCAACHHVALLTPEALLRAGLSARIQGSRPQRAAPMPRMWEEGAGGGFGEVARTGPVSGCSS
jgi:hypothetical protein